MQHLDEGTIHAWLDDALPADEAATVAAHIEQCTQCAAAVAEARGLIAASSRILSALDVVPSDVIPAEQPQTSQRGVASATPRPIKHKWYRRPAFQAAATMAAAAVGIFWIVGKTHPPEISSGPERPSAVSTAISEDTPKAEAYAAEQRVEQSTAPTSAEAPKKSRVSSQDQSNPEPLVAKNTDIAARSQPFDEPATTRSTAPADSARQAAAAKRVIVSSPVVTTQAPSARELERRGNMQALTMGRAPRRAGVDSPVLLQTFGCAEITIQVYDIGTGKPVTLLSQSVLPDVAQRESIPLSGYGGVQRKLESSNARSLAQQSGKVSSKLVIPGLEQCTPDVKRTAQIDSTASVVRWIDLARQREYLLHGLTSPDTLTLVKNALAKTAEHEGKTSGDNNKLK